VKAAPNAMRWAAPAASAALSAPRVIAFVQHQRRLEGPAHAGAKMMFSIFVTGVCRLDQMEIGQAEAVQSLGTWVKRPLDPNLACR